MFFWILGRVQQHPLVCWQTNSRSLRCSQQWMGNHAKYGWKCAVEIIWWFPKSWGYPKSWMVKKGTSHRSKWMMTGGTPISGNLHLVCPEGLAASKPVNADTICLCCCFEVLQHVNDKKKDSCREKPSIWTMWFDFETYVYICIYLPEASKFIQIQIIGNQCCFRPGWIKASRLSRWGLFRRRQRPHLHDFTDLRNQPHDAWWYLMSFPSSLWVTVQTSCYMLVPFFSSNIRVEQNPITSI